MSFQGSLKELRLPDIIQLVSVTGKTGAFHMKKGSETGRIYLQKGTIVDADYREMRGEQALYALAVWNEGSFNFVPEAAAKERTINKANTTPLREAAERPAHISDGGKALWRAVVPDRVLSPGRVALLQEALSALDRADQARVILEKEGLTVVTESTGMVRAHPLIRVEKDSRQLFIRAWDILGLTWDGLIDGVIR